MLIVACVAGAVLVIAAILSVTRVLRNSAPEKQDDLAAQGAVDNAGAAVAINSLLSQEEIDRQHAQYQPPAPAIPASAAAQPAVAPTNQNKDEVILQQAKAKLNRRIAERMKQYIRDNPGRDTWELEKQIKKRENQGAQIQ